MKEKTTKKIGIFEITTLIIGIIAFAYIINESMPLVNAVTEVQGLSCCEKTKQGAYCQYVSEEECDPTYRDSPSQCEYVDYCKLGCCYSTNTGWCSKATPELLCNGEWTEDRACNIPQCSRGCCLIGRNAIFTTEKNCEVKADFFGTTPDFRPEVDTELECIFLAEREEQGACVFGTKCTIQTKEACTSTGGQWYRDKYCSDSQLNTECIAHDHEQCDEQSVYWYDSCGNREEVKEECSIFEGTICRLIGTEHTCTSIDCEVEIDGKTVKKKNGESWCVYEGTIGEGRDPVGSRHNRHVCFMGEERIEPCQDYRNQICVQSDTDLGNGEVFSEASCRVNQWRQCLDYNTIEDKAKMEERCDENPDCYLKNVYVDKYFSFSYCTPQYPPGFDLTTDVSGKNAELVCAMANQQCTVVYVKDWDGDWDCEANCHCEDAIFTQEMNEFCTSLGDCGAYTNVVGEVTDDGYSVLGAPKLQLRTLEKLSKYAQTIPGQKAEPGNLTGLYGGTDVFVGESEGDIRLGNAMGVMGVGLAVGVASLYAVGYSGPVIQATGHVILGGTSEVGATAMAASQSTVLGAFANVLGAVGAVMATASLLSMVFKMDYGDALAAAALGGAAGVILYMHFAGAGLSEALGVLGVVGLIIAVIIIVLQVVFGVGDTKEKIVTFKCYPWQAPFGGDDCSKCNDFDSCSDYKCQSLGQGCKLINKGTEQQRCVDATPGDVSSPKITPWYDFISEGYEYNDVINNGFELTEEGGKCIPEFTNVQFGVETDRPAQCKIGTSPLEDYDEMLDYFGGSNLYLENHSNMLVIPSVEAIKNQYELTPTQVSGLGDINFYVKCRGVNGKANDAAYVIKTCVRQGPDITAPMITKTQPENNGYIKYNSTEVKAAFWTNEPANCKYSLADKNYDQMENSMICNTNLESGTFYGYLCNATLDVTENTKFYVRCQDISENNNTMTQSYEYNLHRSESELRIVSTYPQDGDTVKAGSEPATLELEVLTSGGAENGKAICSYKFRENAQFIKFYETNSNKHLQTLDSVTDGSYQTWIQCEDVAGNTANTAIKFTLDVDKGSPMVARAYYDSGLKVITDEDAKCAYSTTDARCNFEIGEEEDIEMMSGEGKTHAAPWQTENTYYIKCQDQYGNAPGRCSITIRPYDLI